MAAFGDLPRYALASAFSFILIIAATAGLLAWASPLTRHLAARSPAWMPAWILEALGVSDRLESPQNVLLGLSALTIVVGVPASYLIAIFRHGLWDLDVVIKKTVLAVVIAVVFGGIAALAVGGYAAVAISGGDRTNAAVVGAILDRRAVTRVSTRVP